MKIEYKEKPYTKAKQGDKLTGEKEND